MDENEIILEGEYGEYTEEPETDETIEQGDSSEDGLPSSEESTATNTDVLDQIRELLEDENNEESVSNNHILDDQDDNQNNTSYLTLLDIKDLLIDIDTELFRQGEVMDETIEDSGISIMDKPLNEYTVTESLIAVGVACFVAYFLWNVFEKYIPRVGKSR